MQIENLGHNSIWPRRYTIIGLCVLAVFVCYIDRVNISVAIIAMQAEYGWNETTKGLVLSSFFIGYMLFMVPSGWLANRLGGKLILGAAVLWWSVFTFLTPVAANLGLALLIVTRIAMGAGEAAMFPSAYNLYARWVPEKERSRAVALLIGGIPLGTLFALVVTGWLVNRFGWESVFYIFGVSGIFWYSLWYFFGHNDPQSDPKCGQEEKALLSANIFVEKDTANHGSEKSIPWGKFFKTPAIWALIANHFCSNWGFYMLLAWLPSYFSATLKLDIVNAGIYSAAPWLTMFIVGNLGGFVADKLVGKGIELITVRKIMQITGLIGSGLCFWVAQDVTSAPAALSLMCGALGLVALTWSGFVPNHLDIAPKYADVLMGLTNTAGTIPGIIGIAVTGWIVETTGSYASAFALCAAINFTGAIIWFFFAKAEELID
ncbi:MAG: ACS family MFS transporter [Pseudomonadota bacterium]|nr:ACS family MFS transporter [Pseudomonadota bacterium]